jgi:SNF2 family DNA or RNA helicase
MHSNINTISRPIKWVLINDVVKIKNGNNNINISSSDIVRVEFKGIQSINGITILSKPSEDLEHIRFHRFPIEFKIGLFMPASSAKRPYIQLYVALGEHSLTIDNLPETDQIIYKNVWYPLLQNNIEEIQNLLSKFSILGSGPITLRKALDLIKERNSIIKIETAIDEYKNEAPLSSSTDESINIITSMGFNAVMYPYQKNGFSWLKSIAEEELGCILADEMGLGKTLQIIATISYFKTTWNLPSLIITPSTLLENWRREFNHFAPHINVHVHSGNRRTGLPSKLRKYDIIICSYDTAVRDQGMLNMLEWGFVVLDEAQAIKNTETRRASAAKGLKRRVSIAVTGTPVENRLTDLWSLMDFACPGLLGTLETFKNKFENDNASAKELEPIVSPLILRRRISEVASDLPNKIIIPQPINMSEAEANGYELIRQQAIEEYGKSASFITLLRLRQYCTHPMLLEPNADISNIQLMQSSKVNRLMEILEEVFMNGEKAILFTSFTTMSDIICSLILNTFQIQCWQIDGRTPIAERQMIVDLFSENNGSALLVLNPRAAGTGLNITAATHVIHYNLEWNPAVEDQATARAFRRGQNLPVTVHRLFYPDTIEEVINDRLNRKRDLAEIAVIGTKASEIEAADIAKALQLSPSNNLNIYKP